VLPIPATGRSRADAMSSCQCSVYVCTTTTFTIIASILPGRMWPGSSHSATSTPYRPHEVHGSAGCLRVGIPARELTQAPDANKCLIAVRVTSIGGIANRSEWRSAELGMVCVLGQSVEFLHCWRKRVGMLSVQTEYMMREGEFVMRYSPAMRHMVSLGIKKGGLPPSSPRRIQGLTESEWHSHGVRQRNYGAVGLHVPPASL